MEEVLKPKQTKNLLELFETVFIALAFCLVIYFTIAVPNKVEGVSMEPTFYENDLVITNKTVSYLGDTQIGQSRDYDYRRGDVIITHHNDTDLIKRIIATEGETVEIKNNNVYIDGERLVEQYIPPTTRTKLPTSQLSTFRNETKIVVPEDSYFLMGDNREESKDSRFKDIGFISRNEIKGRVFLRYWPLSSFGLIHTGEYSFVN